MKRKILTMLVTFALMLGVCNVGEFDSKASEVDVNVGTATDAIPATEEDTTVPGEAPGVSLHKWENYYYYGERGGISISFTNDSGKKYTISDYKGYYLFEDGTTEELKGQFLDQITPIDTIVGGEIKIYDEEMAYSGCYYSFQTDFIPYKYLGASVVQEIEIQDEEGNTYTYYYNSGKVLEREDLYEYEIKTDDEIAPGKTMTFEITVTNVYKELIILRQVTFEYYSDISDYNTWELLDCDVKLADGTYPTNDLGDVVTDGNAPIRLEPGQSSTYLLTCTVPETYSLKALLRMYSWAMVPNGGPTQMKTYSFLTNKVSCEELTDFEAGQKAKVRMYVTSSVDTNLDSVVLNYHNGFTWTAEAYENPTSQVPVTFTDEAGNAISDISKVAISAGETKIVDMTFTVPTTWVEGDVLNVKTSLKDATSAVSESYYPICYVEILEDVNVADGTPDVSIPTGDDNSLGDSVDFTKEEIEKGAKGGKLEVEFRAGTVDASDVSSEDLAEIKGKAEDKEIATIVDLSVNKYVNGEHQGKVDKLRKKVKITIDVPEEYRDKNYDFSIIKMHNGVATELLDLDDNPNTVTFMTDEFSLYTMAYEEKVEDTTTTSTTTTTTTTADKEDTTTTTSTATTTTETNSTAQSTDTTQSNQGAQTGDAGPQTGDNANIAIICMLMLLSGFIAVIMSKKYVTNK